MNDTLLDLKEEVEVDSSNIWDPIALGGIITGRRIGAGIRRREDLPAAVLKATGYSVSENTIGAIERGERLPSLTTLTAVMLTLGLSFQDLAGAVDEEQREKYRRLSR